MKKTFLKRMAGGVAVFLQLLAFASCVNDEYEISEERLDLNVTIFQEGVSLPLGSTAKINLDTLYSRLDDKTKEMLQKIEGAYLFSLADDYDMTKEIKKTLSGIGGIKAMPFNEKFKFSLSNVDLSSLEIKGQPVTPEPVDLSDMLDVPDINKYLPKVNQRMDKITASIPKLESDALDIDKTSVENISKTTTILSISLDPAHMEILRMLAESAEGEKEMTYDQVKESLRALKLPALVEKFNLDTVTFTLPMDISLPKEIKEVQEIKLHDNASFEMIVTVIDPVFTAGSLTPVVDADMHNLFHIDGITQGSGDGGHIGGSHPGEPGHDNHFADHVYDNFVLAPNEDAASNWRADHIYHIASLAIEPSDWSKADKDSPLVLDKDCNVMMTGLLEKSGLKTTFKKLYEWCKAGKSMKVQVDIRIIDLVIDDVKMVLEPITVQKELTVPVNIAGVTMPDMVKKIEYVAFSNAPEKQLNLDIDVNVPETCSGIDLKLEPLELVFPQGMVIQHEMYQSQTRTLKYEQSIAGGLHDRVYIEKMEFPALTGNTFSYSGEVKVNAVAVASGTLSSKSLMSAGKDSEISVEVGVTYEPELTDYSVVIDDYVYDVEVNPVTIDEPLGKEVGEMLKDNSINVSLRQDVPGENQKVVITIDYPEHEALRILPKADTGLKIDFPDLMIFAKKSIEEYGINEDNSIHFKGETSIPRRIELEIEKIKVEPVYVEQEDNYFLKDKFEITGGVRLVGGTFGMKTVEDIADLKAKVGFSAVIPDLAPDKIGMDKYFVSIDKEVVIDGMNMELPEQVDSIKVTELLLKDVCLDLSVDAATVADLVGADASLALVADLHLPKMLMVEGAGEGNILHIEESLDNDGKIVLDPVRVLGLDLSGLKAAEGKLSMDEQKINVKGSISLSNVSINMDDLKDKQIEVAIVGSLSSRDDKGNPTKEIAIDRIEGCVGFSIDPVKTSIDLSDVAKALNGDNLSATLDLNTFWLTLDVDTNIDVPVAGSLSVTPYFGNIPGQSQTVKIEMDWEGRGEDGYKYIVSNTDPSSAEAGGRLDVYKGYEYHYLDLISMLYSKEEGQKPVLADSLQIALAAGVDGNKRCVIEPSKDYRLGVDYRIGVPLELGEDFAFEYRDTVSGLPDMLDELLAYGSLGLGGEITNGLPLRLDLQIRLLDSDGQVIPMAEGAGQMKIASCDAEGNAVTTPVDLIISSGGADISDLSAIELVFKANAKDAAGVPLRSDTFIQAKLNARIPDGVTLDLKDYIKAEEKGTNE